MRWRHAAQPVSAGDVSLIQNLAAVAVAGGYMWAAQDAQPWHVSLAIATLIGGFLMAPEPVDE